jgi:hypothetical protein
VTNPRERRLEGVAQEIAQEKAASLGRAGARLERALQTLRELDEVREPGGARDLEQIVAERAARVDAAAAALFDYVVQREACGFRDTERIMRELEVPREVQLRMGVRGR